MKNMKVVLQKFIAEAGVCSRRKAEEMIRSGKVFVNGTVAELGMKASDKDNVLVNGRKVEKQAKIYIKINKPIGYVCSNRSFKNEKSVFGLLKNVRDRLFVVGRLDKDSRGLLLLTNDGDLTKILTHPKYEHEKEYEVLISEIDKNLNLPMIIKSLEKGFSLKDLGFVKIKKVKDLGSNKLSVILTEGKKRQIRRMFGFVGLKVRDLKRIRINKLTLGTLKEGESDYLSANEIGVLT